MSEGFKAWWERVPGAPRPTGTMKLAEVLSGPERWCRDSYWLPDSNGANRFCLVGAMEWAGYTSDRSAARVNDIIAERIGRRLARVSFNDGPTTTWDDIAWVVAEFDRRTMLEGT